MARLPKSIIKKYGITKKAWAVFRGRSRSRSKSKTKTRSVKKTARRRYYRRRRRGGGGKSMTRTAFKLIRLGALAAPAVIALTKGGSTDEKIRDIIARYTGYDIKTGDFQAYYLGIGWGPYLMACLTTYGIPKISSIIRRL